MAEVISIIGGAGFIGTSLSRLLASRFQPFEILDLHPSRVFPERSKIVDIRDLDSLRASLAGQRIVHLAAVHRDDVADPRLYTDTNVFGTEKVCQVARERNIRHILFTSSVAVYGFAPVGTDESGPVRPANAYGQSKWEAERALNRWQAEDPTERRLTIVRPTAVFGPGNRGNIYNLLRQISSGMFVMIGNGQNKKSLAYVENIAEFLYQLCVNEPRNMVINYVDEPDLDMNSLVVLARESLGRSGRIGWRLPYPAGLALGHLADVAARLLRRPLPVSAIRVQKFCATTSFRSAKHELCGFVAPISLAEGLRRTVRAEFVDPDPDRQIFLTE